MIAVTARRDSCASLFGNREETVKPSFLIISAIVLLSAAPAWTQTPDATTIAAGKSILAKHCGECHQIEAAGASKLAAAPPFRELMQRYNPEDLEEALGEGLASGHPDMPEFVFEPDDIAAIVAYFGTLKR
jgi:cytochrome c